ncbi:MAG: HAD-IIIA family hydrolase [Bacteroidetes bacterium]|nr:HAD-IIIA family hydrolase [Bacteroidota bacterium]
MIYDTFKTINTFIFDVDGVLTSGKVLAQDDGSLTRDFNIKDGFAIQFAVKQNYRLIIISGGSSHGVKNRLHGLGIEEVYTGVSDKKELFEKLIKKHNLDLTKTLYMGDDFPDISSMRMCGVKTCPADAAWQVQQEADVITKAKGGQGAAREVIEQVLTLQDKWESTEHSVW